MCTAITYKTCDHYFGRNLDLEFSYNETVTITPRNYEFFFRMVPPLSTHYAMIGMAYVVDNFPLYYDATNEVGLSMAGLNFPGNAYYQPLPEKPLFSCRTSDYTSATDTPYKTSGCPAHIAPFEFIPWVLGQCRTIHDVKQLLTRTVLTQIDFSDKLPNTPLHFMIADQETSITVEPTLAGLQIHDNPVGVLTNNPPFETQLFQLNNYMQLSAEMPENHFSEALSLEAHSRGMGAIGLPGDLSSQSRFVRASFVKMNSVSASTEPESVSQFFHILSSVEQQRGCVHIKDNQYEITVYSSCCNTDKGIYYYTTYDNRRITGVDMHKYDLSTKKLLSHPLVKEQQILMM